jgi:hypothetical protein
MADKFAIGTDDGWEVDCNAFADKFAIGTDDGWEVVMASPRDPTMADGFGMERKKDLPFLVASWFYPFMARFKQKHAR